MKNTQLAGALALTILSAGLLALSLVLGGGTHVGFFSDAVLQLVAVPVLVIVAYAARGTRRFWVLAMCGLMLALIQLVPLPPGIWPLLPGRGALHAALETVSTDLVTWRPVSLDPAATLAGLCLLIPPFAIFLGVTLLPAHARLRVTSVLLGLVAAHLLLGLLQVAGGPESPWRFFNVTNPTEAVGLFANRNHFSALLYVGLVFGAASVIIGLQWCGNQTAHASEDQLRRIVILTAAFAWLVAILGTQIMTRSRAGLGLTILALAFLPLLATVRSARTTRGVYIILFAAIAVAAVFASEFAFGRYGERLIGDPLADDRIAMTRNTLNAIWNYAPFGTGIGTFVPVYAASTPPADLYPAYANRAHNDLLEVLLENGAFGLILLCGFTCWFFSRTVSVWRNGATDEIASLILARAASIAIALLALHSLVDYPLRTAALMAALAFASALLIPPPRTSAAATTQPRNGGPSQVVNRDQRWPHPDDWPDGWQLESPAFPGQTKRGE